MASSDRIPIVLLMFVVAAATAENMAPVLPFWLPGAVPVVTAALAQRVGGRPMAAPIMLRVPDVEARVKMAAGWFHWGTVSPAVSASPPKTTLAAAALIEGEPWDAAGTAIVMACIGPSIST